MRFCEVAVQRTNSHANSMSAFLCTFVMFSITYIVCEASVLNRAKGPAELMWERQKYII